MDDSSDDPVWNQLAAPPSNAASATCRPRPTTSATSPQPGTTHKYVHVGNWRDNLESVDSEDSAEDDDETDYGGMEASVWRKHSDVSAKQQQWTLMSLAVDKDLTPGNLLPMLQQKSTEKEEEEEEEGEVNRLHGDYDGYGVIHAVVLNKSKHRAQCLLALLVNSSADVNLQRRGKKSSPLHCAVRIRDSACVQMLVSFGADINARDSRERTPLDLAVQMNVQHIEMMLRDVGAELGRGGVRTRARPPKRTLYELEEGGALTGAGGDSRSETESPSSPPPPPLSLSRHEMCDGGVLNSSSYSSSSASENGVAIIKGAFQRKSTSELLESGFGSMMAGGEDANDDCGIDPVQFKKAEDNVWRRIMDPNSDCSSAEEALELVKTQRELALIQQHRGSRILFLDGGGIRGLLQIQVLSEIQRKAGMEITKLFDWIVGTSTGAIIALGLVQGRKSLQEVRRIYFQMKEDVFKSSGLIISGFDTGNLELHLKKNFGEALTMESRKWPRVLVPAVFKERSALELHFFNNCFDNQYTKKTVFEVARASSAAPATFTEFNNYVDGGLMAYNPCEDGLTEIQEFYRQRGGKLPISLVVSVGSGIPPVRELGAVDLHHTMGPVDLITGRTKQTIDNLMRLISSAMVRSEATAKNCESRCNEQGIEFVRFNPRLIEDIDSGELSDKKLLDMLWNTQKYMHEEEQAEKLAKISRHKP